jgi:hypothetical protein
MTTPAPRHAAPKHTVRWIIVTVVSLLVLSGIGYIVVRYPNLGIVHPHSSVPSCRYTAKKVTVVVDGPDCTPVMRQVADSSDIAWGWAKTFTGRPVAELTNGKSTIWVYDAGNPALAGALARHFTDAKWIVEAPSPTPAP